jgi:hypothetical protein
LVTQTATNLNRRLYGELTLAPKPKPKAKPKPRAPKAAPSPPKTPPQVMKAVEEVLKVESEPLPLPPAEPVLPTVCRLCTVWDLPQLGDIPASGAFSLFAAMKF